MEYYNTVSFKQRSKRAPTMTYLRLEDKRVLMKQCNSDAVILFEYYLAKAGVENFAYSDETAARALGWTERKVQEVRKKLTKADYFFQERGKYSSGRKIVSTYLGRQTVLKLKHIEHYEIIVSSTLDDEPVEDAYSEETQRMLDAAPDLGFGLAFTQKIIASIKIGNTIIVDGKMRAVQKRNVYKE